MLQKIWQIASGVVSRQRTGLDNGNIEHIRADLRFRLALVEYAYFGRSGKRVAHRLVEIKSLLGEKGTHRYLRALDPDLRDQFVERIQGARRGSATGSARRPPKDKKQASDLSLADVDLDGLAPNVVSIKSAAGKMAGSAPVARNNPSTKQNSAPVDSGE